METFPKDHVQPETRWAIAPTDRRRRRPGSAVQEQRVPRRPLLEMTQPMRAQSRNPGRNPGRGSRRRGLHRRIPPRTHRPPRPATGPPVRRLRPPDRSHLPRRRRNSQGPPPLRGRCHRHPRRLWDPHRVLRFPSLLPGPAQPVHLSSRIRRRLLPHPARPHRWSPDRPVPIPRPPSRPHRSLPRRPPPHRTPETQARPEMALWRIPPSNHPHPNRPRPRSERPSPRRDE